MKVRLRAEAEVQGTGFVSSWSTFGSLHHISNMPSRAADIAALELATFRAQYSYLGDVALFELPPDCGVKCEVVWRNPELLPERFLILSYPILSYPISSYPTLSCCPSASLSSGVMASRTRFLRHT